MGLKLVALLALLTVLSLCGGTLFLELFLPPGNGVTSAPLREEAAARLLRAIGRTRSDEAARKRSAHRFSASMQRVKSEWDAAQLSAWWLLSDNPSAVLRREMIGPGTATTTAAVGTASADNIDLLLDQPFAVAMEDDGDTDADAGADADAAELRPYQQSLDLHDAFYRNVSIKHAF